MQLELVTEFDTNDAQKESLVGEGGGSKSAKGGPYPLADLDGGEGRRVQCRFIQWSSDSFHYFNSTVLHSMIRKVHLPYNTRDKLICFYLGK